MTLKGLFTAILSSNVDDWNLISCAGPGGGPSYRSRFWFIVRDGVQLTLEEASHQVVAAYKSDLSITMAWGLDCERDFGERWAQAAFPASRASSHHADVFYGGALVYRTLYVTLDGGRTKLPKPPLSPDILEVPVDYSRFIHLLNRLEGHVDYEDYFQRAGLLTIAEDWPK
jgi:hypothetical protein